MDHVQLVLNRFNGICRTYSHKHPVPHTNKRQASINILPLFAGAPLGYSNRCNSPAAYGKANAVPEPNKGGCSRQSARRVVRAELLKYPLQVHPPVSVTLIV